MLQNALETMIPVKEEEEEHNFVQKNYLWRIFLLRTKIPSLINIKSKGKVDKNRSLPKDIAKGYIEYMSVELD